MSLPKRVQAELDAALALEGQMHEQMQQVAPAIQSVSDLVQPAANEPPSEPQQAAPVEPVAAPVAPKEDFEHKYRVLQGMYTADIKTLRTQLGDIVTEVRTLKAQPAAPATQPAPVDPKDIENFGADLIEMVQRYAEQKMAGMESRLTALEQGMNGVTQQTALTAEQAFYATLDSLVPDWRAVNENPDWLAWLNEVDPVYDVPRQAALDRAFGKKNAPQVATIFKAYKATIPAIPAPSSLANQVAPSGAASVAPTAAPAKPFFSEKSITDFYRDLGQGRWKGRETEAAAIEAEINSAVAEGRVR